MKTQKYERQEHAIIAVDTVIFGIIDEKLHALLIQINKPELKGKWAFPGGLIGHGESLEQAARRILERKAGIKDVLLDQLATFGDPERDPFGHVVSVSYLALVDAGRHTLKTTDQYDDVAWYPVDKMPPLAYDHKEMLQVALSRLAGKMTYTNIVQGMLEKEFTLTELQESYELVLGKQLDKRNFRKKILSLGMVKDTGRTRGGMQSRPAALYKFVSKEVQEYQVL